MHPRGRSRENLPPHLGVPDTAAFRMAVPPTTPLHEAEKAPNTPSLGASAHLEALPAEGEGFEPSSEA